MTFVTTNLQFPRFSSDQNHFPALKNKEKNFKDLPGGVENL